MISLGSLAFSWSHALCLLVHALSCLDCWLYLGIQTKQVETDCAGAFPGRTCPR